MSNNLELSQVAPSQNDKEVTINDQAGQLDAGLTDKVDVVLTGTTSPLVERSPRRSAAWSSS